MPRREIPAPEVVRWADVGPEFVRRWGHPKGKFMPEHLKIYGPSGVGKSYAQGHILRMRAELYGSHSVYIFTKPADDTVEEFGWPVISKWPPKYDQPNVIFWRPAPPGSDDLSPQREAIRSAMRDMWDDDANIVVAIDEAGYLADDLNLKIMLNRYYREARALGITVSSASQRAQGAPRHMASESPWTIAFKPVDEDDAERVGQTFGSRYYRDILMDLDRDNHEFLLKQDGTPPIRTHIE